MRRLPYLCALAVITTAGSTAGAQAPSAACSSTGCLPNPSVPVCSCAGCGSRRRRPGRPPEGTRREGLYACSQRAAAFAAGGEGHSSADHPGIGHQCRLESTGGDGQPANAQACLSLHGSESGSGVHLFVSNLAPVQPARFAAWKTAQAAWVTRSLALAGTLNSALLHAGMSVTLGNRPARGGQHDLPRGRRGDCAGTRCGQKAGCRA